MLVKPINIDVFSKLKKKPTFCGCSFLGIDINFSNMVFTDETEESKFVSWSSISSG